MIESDAQDLQGELTFANQAGHLWNDFWQRFGGQPVLHGKRVLDFGCNRGGSVHRALQEGAASAVGIDVNSITTQFGQEKLSRIWGDRTEILCGDIRDMETEPFDIVISINTMEHVADIEGTLSGMVAKCRPGGELFIGFGPLWYSPYEHHHYPRTRLPWMHLLRGDDFVLDDLAKYVGRRYDTPQEAGFNCETPDRFHAALRAQDVEILSARRNVGRSAWRSRVSRSMLAFAVVPALEKYVTVGIYWHLRKPPAQKESSS
ncbi:MAG: class I SAM-dependent methyltransferase [Alteraurantiacibacter sp.]